MRVGECSRLAASGPTDGSLERQPGNMQTFYLTHRDDKLAHLRLFDTLTALHNRPMSTRLGMNFHTLYWMTVRDMYTYTY
jgi:hypothetical protein